MQPAPEFVTVADAERVEAWSSRRLPFEPKGPMVELRSAIRAGLAGLHRGRTLRCVYASPTTDFCDSENVLLYNVGMSGFTGLIDEGLTFERAFNMPPAPERLSGTALHHHAYLVDDGDEFHHWNVERVAATWHGIAPERAGKAADWWWATRCAARSQWTTDLAGKQFGLRIILTGTRRSIAGVLKPMLDGAIAAFHRDPALSDEATERLARYLHLDEAVVRDGLTASSAPLGARPIVRPFRQGLQWNPADDLCVACTIGVRPGTGTARIDGDLLQLSSALPPG
jgi:hypothetical protein